MCVATICQFIAIVAAMTWERPPEIRAAIVTDASRSDQYVAIANNAWVTTLFYDDCNIEAELTGIVRDSPMSATSLPAWAHGAVKDSSPTGRRSRSLKSIPIEQGVGFPLRWLSWRGTADKPTKLLGRVNGAAPGQTVLLPLGRLPSEGGLSGAVALQYYVPRGMIGSDVSSVALLLNVSCIVAIWCVAAPVLRAFVHAVRRRSQRCTRCGYSVCELVSSICPECGASTR